MDHVKEIEAILDSQLAKRWSSIAITVSNSKLSPLPLRAIWRIDFVDGDINYPNINFLFIAVDEKFPYTQPIVWLPQYLHDKNMRWPHIESTGKLCLPRSSVIQEPAQRIIQHLAWAQELLQMNPTSRRKEFAREFIAYWNQDRSGKDVVYSLLSLKAESRLIVYSAPIGQIFFAADTTEQLTQYLQHLNDTSVSIKIYQGYLLWLDNAWCPHEFPISGRDVLNFIPKDIQDKILAPGRDCLIVIGTKLGSEAVFVSALLKSEELSKIRKGFRATTALPARKIREAFTVKKIMKIKTTRVDGAWIHGRDKDPQYEILRKKRVVICGCGSLGSSVARLLAQAGVGTLHLIDNDNFEPHNASRHLLGVGSSGVNKTDALRKLLLNDFPHMVEITAHDKTFEMLTQQELDVLCGADVILSAGIDIASDLILDEWRRTQGTGSVHVCAWAEAYAAAGHAVALWGDDSVRDIFDEDMKVTFRLCDLPENANHLVAVAGCGDVFQPHGAIELQSVVNISARTIVDILTNKINGSMRRTWFGNREEAVRNQLRPRETFDNNLCIKDFL